MNETVTQNARRVRFGLGSALMIVIAASVWGAGGIGLLLVLPMAAIPVIIYIALLRTMAWSVGVGLGLFATWIALRSLPLSDDGLHGVYWFTAVPLLVLLAWAVEQKQLRSRT